MLQAGDTVSGDAVPVVDTQLETVEFYKIGKLKVRVREAEEETGLTNLKSFNTIFDLDIHLIPSRKDFPEHFHYDIRFLVEGDESEKIVVSDESHDVKWVSLNDLENFTKERSVLRMKDKVLNNG